MYVRIMAIVLILVQGLLPIQQFNLVSAARQAPSASAISAMSNGTQLAADMPALAMVAETSAPAAVSEDSLERPPVTYSTRGQMRHKHADLAISDVTQTSHYVYTRDQGSQYTIYYQQRPFVDYDLHSSPEIVLGTYDTSIEAYEIDAYQYPRIATDIDGGIHVTWAIKDRLYYRYCQVGADGDCSSTSQWDMQEVITWGPWTIDCPIYHLSIVAWRNDAGKIDVAISFFIGGSTNKVIVLQKHFNEYHFTSTVVDTVTPEVGVTPSIAVDEISSNIHIIYNKYGSGLMYAVLPYGELVTPPQILISATDSAFAPLNLTAGYEANFVSGYGIQATPEQVYISYPNASQRIIFISCADTCSGGPATVVDLTTSLTSTALHDVRVMLTEGKQPAIIWKDPTNRIKLAAKHDDTWGAASTLYSSSNYTANLIGQIDKNGATHIGWTEMILPVQNGDYSASSDHYFQQVQEPVIFIPGTLGSSLYDTEEQDEYWPYEGYFDMARLTLDPNVPNRLQHIIGGHVLKFEYADDLFTKLGKNGYVEYHVDDLNARRTKAGCNKEQRQARPNLFPFAYDWRLATDTAVAGLDEYISCIRIFYPSVKINLVTHSLGTMIGRKYILSHGSNDIRALVTMGGPWWGAPGTIKSYRGEYLPQIPKALESSISKTFPSLAEMSPSKAFFVDGHVPIHENGADFNGDKLEFGALIYDQYVVGMERNYNPNFGAINEASHSVAGLDTWSPALEAVEFHNIYSIYTGKTIDAIIYQEILVCGFTCYMEDGAKYIEMDNAGDSTVTTHVLEGGAPQGPNAETLSFSEDDYTHAENIDNPRIQACILTVLIKGWCTPHTQTDPPPGPGPLQAASVEPDTRFLTLRGMERIQLTDGAGLTADLDLTTGVRTGTSPIRIEELGANAVMVVLPGDQQASLRLTRFPREVANIEALKGQSNVVVNQLVRFQDIAAPAASSVTFTVLPGGIEEVQVDDTSDGMIDHTYAPHANVSDATSVDITPPAIVMNRTVLTNNQVSITISASDASGVAALIYSLDGTHFTPYTGPITVDAYAIPSVYVSADDTLTNRSGLYTQDTRMLALNGPLTVTEGQGSLNIPVHMDLPGGQKVKVRYTIAPNSATADADYTPAQGILEFDPNQQDQQIVLPIIDDTTDEDDETVTISLSFPENAGFAQREQQITIVDNDAAPSVKFTATAFSGDEDSGAIVANIVLSQPSAKTITVSYSTGGGTATPGSDYTPQTNATVTINPGESTANVSIPVILDFVHWEPGETFGVQLTSATNAILGTPNAATITIDTDALALGPLAFSYQERVGTLNIPVKLASKRTQQVTVNYQTIADSAAADLDYVSTNGILTFEPGETIKYIPLTVIEDGIPEENERFELQLSNAINATLFPGDFGGGGSIAPLFTIAKNDHLSWSTYDSHDGDESAGVFQATIFLDQPSAQEVTLEYATVDGSAIAGDDYVGAVGTLVRIPAGQTFKLISIPIVDDSLLEGNETFSIQLSNPTNAGLNAPTLFPVTILANDVPTPTPTTAPTLTPLPTNSVLFVTGTTATASDTAVINRLKDIMVDGTKLNVIVKTDSTVTAADAGNGIRLVLISSSVASTNIGTKFTNTTVPVMVWEYGLFDDMGMTGTSSGTHFGETAAGTQLTISQPGHPLAAGLTGTVNVHTTAQVMSYGSGLPASAITVAYVPGTSTRSLIWGYESGTAMVGLNAPARRVGFFFYDASASNPTPQSWQLFEAAVSWALGSSAAPTPTATTPPTATATATSLPTATATATSPPTATATSVPTNTPTSTPVLSFQNYVTYPGGNTNGLCSSAIGDFNSDSRQDVVVGHCSEAKLSLFLASSDGTLNPATVISTLIEPGSIGPARDFTGDGKLDLLSVYSNYSSTVFKILVGDGAGHFVASSAEYYATPLASTMTTGDFNGDGKPDLAFGDVYNDGLSILLNDGAGHFPSETTYPLDAGTSVHGMLASMRAVDLNRDTTLDLVIALPDSNQLAIMRGVGDGTFQAPVYLSAPVSSVHAGDIDEDGYVDLLVSADTSKIFWGTANGTFGAPTTLALASTVADLTDLNGDGHLDIVGFASVNSSSFDLLRITVGSGNGTFAASVETRSALYPNVSHGIKIADLNGDGRRDLLTLHSNQISVMIANPTSAPTATPLPSATPTSAPTAKTALLVVNNAGGLNSGDSAVQTRLIGLGYTVSAKTASTSAASDATGKTLVLISSSVTSGDVAAKFKSVPVPVIVWEQAVYDDMSLTGVELGTDYGTASSSSLVISNAGHGLAGGLSGTVTVFSAAALMPYGAPSANAINLAPQGTSTSKKVYFAYDRNAAMAGGFSVNARRVGLFWVDTATPTPDAWTLFNAAVNWATMP